MSRNTIVLGVFFAAARAASADPVPAPPSALVRVQIGPVGSRGSEQALTVGSDGEWGEVQVEGVNAPSTKVRLKLVARQQPMVAFDVSYSDKIEKVAARGEVQLPPPGKRVVVARLGRAAGVAEEVAITIDGK